MSDRKSKLEQRAQKLLQESAEQLDGRTQSRLTQARHAALDALKQPERKAIGWWLSAGGVGTVAVVLAVMIATNPTLQSETGDPQLAATPVDEMEIVTAEDSLEFYRDVEFYAWLDTVLEDEPVEAGGA